MSVLYIRDKDGNFIPLKTIKGDSGEPGYTPQRGIDYWTEEDKQEIIGETKEQVSESLDGEVVRFADDIKSADRSLGMTMGYADHNDAISYITRNNKLLTLPRTIRIDNKVYEPFDNGEIVLPDSYTLPTASPTVKGGVMIGDGLEMDGEKVRVKDMPELIATLTVEKESVMVVISKDVSENSFALKNATVLLTFPDGASLGQVYVGVKEYKWVSFSSDALSNKYLRVHIFPIGGGLWTGYTIWSRDLLISSTPTYSVQYCEDAGDKINKIAMRFPQNIPVGTTIKVYGVRA